MDVRIHNGIVRGMHEQDCIAFKGIPFAKPPAGPLRFQPPQPCDDWFGALDCTRYGPRPIQTPPPWCLDRDSAVYAEDCLNLNVWTPAIDGKKRPVLFNIFGGGHMEGSNSEIGSEGYRLMKDRDIVFVSPNYRVGALGYLYLAHLLGSKYEASGNLGLLDQILALQWVNKNIGFFGGDPERVTIVGQSAGGKSVMSLLLAPEASGLFHGAVAMSGSWQHIKDIETEICLTDNFLSAMELHRADAEKLLTCPAEEIRAAQETANKTYFKAESYGSTADGVVLPADIKQTAQKGSLLKVPVMMGHTLQELYPPANADPKEFEPAAVKKRFRWKFGLNWEQPFNHYQKLLPALGPAAAYGEAATEYTYVQSYLQTAEYLMKHKVPLWLYRWDYTGGLWANHSSDNEALFRRTNPEKQKMQPEATAHVDHMFQQAVLRFVKTGNPAAPGLPAWYAIDSKRQDRMLFDAECRTEPVCFGDNHIFPLQAFRLKKERN